MTAPPSPRRFTSDAATGAAYDHGAHVVEWTPAGQAPVLWMSAASRFDAVSPIRGESHTMGYRLRVDSIG